LANSNSQAWQAGPRGDDLALHDRGRRRGPCAAWRPRWNGTIYGRPAASFETYTEETVVARAELALAKARRRRRMQFIGRESAVCRALRSSQGRMNTVTGPVESGPMAVESPLSDPI